MFVDVTTDGPFNVNGFCGVVTLVAFGATCSCDSSTSSYSTVRGALDWTDSMDWWMPLQKKLQRGPKPNTCFAFIRQAIESVQSSATCTVEYYEVEESQEQVAPATTKRGRKPNPTKVTTPQNPSTLKRPSVVTSTNTRSKKPRY